MRKAIIENGKISNVIKCDPDFKIEGKTLVELKNGFSVGDFYENGKFSKMKTINTPDQTYTEKRRAEYPPIGDQLDAILKWITSERFQGEDLPQDLDDIIGKWTAVKKKHPKEVKDSAD